MHRDDLRRLAPQWLNYTHIMRDDMEVGWLLAGGRLAADCMCVNGRVELARRTVKCFVDV